MKISDYIVEFLIKVGVTDCFGYPGGSVTNILDSINKRRDKIHAHVTYHEQGAAFAACGYSVTSGKIGVAYSTGGPGCTNLVTGIAHAYFDSIPVLFISGNVNRYESKGNLELRQRGFQEANNVEAVGAFTKYAAYVDEPRKIKYYMEKAYSIAMDGRKGPVFLDLPMDIQRAEINPVELEGYNNVEMQLDNSEKELFREVIVNELLKSKRPCVLLGNGIRDEKSKEIVREFIKKYNIPYFTSMIAFDILGPNKYNIGFLGAYGTRAANFAAAKSDLIIALGSRMDIRQVGAQRESFAPNAQIIRVDVDEGELKYKVHTDEKGFCMDVTDATDVIKEINIQKDYTEWLNICSEISYKLKKYDNNSPNDYIAAISSFFPSNSIITTDVGQNQVWVAQSLQLKEKQRVLFSGGFGAMGHALPSAIGAYYGSNHRPIICICGDGGLQMNIQELQYIFREKLPIKIIVFNNNALGMIRHFQEMYFDSVFFQTKPEGGYSSPDFVKIAEAYGLKAKKIETIDEITDNADDIIDDAMPFLLEICYFEDTYIIPKLQYGKPNQDQEPLIDRKLFNQLMKM